MHVTTVKVRGRNVHVHVHVVSEPGNSLMSSTSTVGKSLAVPGMSSGTWFTASSRGICEGEIERV